MLSYIKSGVAEGAKLQTGGWVALLIINNALVREVFDALFVLYRTVMMSPLVHTSRDKRFLIIPVPSSDENLITENQTDGTTAVVAANDNQTALLARQIRDKVSQAGVVLVRVRGAIYSIYSDCQAKTPSNGKNSLQCSGGTCQDLYEVKRFKSL